MPSTSSPPLPSTQSSLPPPQTFDIIPPLHTLLSRLLPNPLDPNAQPSLSPKDLATEAAAIKIKIQLARSTVEMLPDVDRTVEEQMEEMRELEERIWKLEKVRKDIVEAAKKG
ncbi:hypothetical protein MMC14_004125 [Varicellaria rhodocarpa]|nr:hypothetical protein [Varicellaria rhodocarpa]